MDKDNVVELATPATVSDPLTDLVLDHDGLGRVRYQQVNVLRLPRHVRVCRVESVGLNDRAHERLEIYRVVG